MRCCIVSSIPPADANTVPTTEPVGGLLRFGGTGDFEELALGSVDDYTDELEMAESDDDDDEDSDGYARGGAVLSLSFGAQTTQIRSDPAGDLGTGAWNAGDFSKMKEQLVVQEVKGNFGGDGEGRYDVYVMEDEFDPDAEVITAVWEGPKGQRLVGTQVRRRRTQQAALMPYWILGSMLAAAGLAVVIGIVAVVILSLAMGPKREIAPLSEANLPVIEIERKPIVPQTADEILEEVLKDPEAPKPR